MPHAAKTAEVATSGPRPLIATTITCYPVVAGGRNLPCAAEVAELRAAQSGLAMELDLNAALIRRTGGLRLDRRFLGTTPASGLHLLSGAGPRLLQGEVDEAETVVVGVAASLEERNNLPAGGKSHVCDNEHNVSVYSTNCRRGLTIGYSGSLLHV